MDRHKLIQDIKSGDYHLSVSALKAFIQSPRSFIEYKLRPRTPATDAIKRGYLFENLSLRDELGGVKIDGRVIPYKVFDDTEKLKDIGGAKPRATKKYREWKAETLKGVPPDCVVTKDLVAEAKAMRDRLWNHPFFKFKMKGDIEETDVKVEWQVNGVPFLGYIDAKGKSIYDTKSIVDASQRKAYYTCRDRQYPLQIANYCNATGLKDGYIVACDASLEVYITRIDPTTVKGLIHRTEWYVDKFLECIDRGAWDQGQEFWTDSGYYEWAEGVM